MLPELELPSHDCEMFVHRCTAYSWPGRRWRYYGHPFALITESLGIPQDEHNFWASAISVQCASKELVTMTICFDTPEA